jgi:AraC-like DNA-binding protein
VIGTLSIKTMFNGRAIYAIEGTQIAVDDARYMILNHAQPYTITIDAIEPVESFCVFYPQSWAGDVLNGLVRSDDDLLLNPYDLTQPVMFYEIPHRHDSLVTPLMRQLMQLHQSGVAAVGMRQELLYDLLVAILQVQRGVLHKAEQVPAARPATRLELYRRLNFVREYMLANLDQEATIAELARIAALSPWHFLRRFRDVFGITPHAWLTQKRLEMAAALIAGSNRSITSIGLEVGFQSSGSFSSLFRKHYHVSPREYRQSLAPRKTAILKK